MKTTPFTSSNEWYEFDQPIQWTSEDEGKGTYLFYNNETWRGNFRITALRISSSANGTEKDVQKKINEHISEELEQNEGAEIVQIGNHEVVGYSVMMEEDGENLLVNYWSFGLDETLFICSFTIESKSKNTRKTKKEMQTCISAISSIRMLN